MARTTRHGSRQQRKKHIRKKLARNHNAVRLSVFRSARHVYAQVIDDASGRTLASASTLSAELKGHEGHRGNRAAAARVGELVAKRALDAGVSTVSFDRNGFLYHGCVKALADAAREAGLQF
jgi:large subunit ribosomal protein L18